MADKLIDLKQNQKAALDKAEALLGGLSHVMTTAENEGYITAMAEYQNVSATIKAREAQSTIRANFGTMPGFGFPNGVHGVIDAPVSAAVDPMRLAAARNPEYTRSLHSFMKSGGKSASAELMEGADGEGGFHIPGSEAFTRQRKANGSYVPQSSAAMYEGADGSSDAAGGYAIEVLTSQLIVPLALPDMGIYDASMVIPTSNSIKIPQQLAFGTSTIKAESTGTIATFGGTDPTLAQTELQAYMVGALRFASFELLQDVKVWQEFVVSDLLAGQRILVDSLLASGTGTNQPLGVFGNTGNGSGLAYELLGTSADGAMLLNSLFDVTSTLRAAYQPNASWIMSRATGLAIRRAQMQANLFAPVATVDADGTERILGRPVFYDVNAPALPATTNAGVLPILFGDFKSAYIIGVRGGAGVNVKILDQPWASAGQVGILAYQRIDGRIRRSEAVQSVTVSHS